jgi:Polyketide cyclase / dehydrase and lipid transport
VCGDKLRRENPEKRALMAGQHKFGAPNLCCDSDLGLTEQCREVVVKDGQRLGTTNNPGRTKDQGPAMKTVSATIQIDAPPAQVWAALTDLAAYPRWNPLSPEASGP